MGIKTPIVTEIAHKTYLINEYGLNVMYLVVGAERALLIDTGSGYCDLKAIVERLTDKPYDVVLTHGHVDHAGGCDIFEKIYIHPDDADMAKNISYESRLGYGNSLRNAMGDSVWDYGEENVRRWESFPACCDLSEGMVFDLGGRALTVYHTPGHTKGSCCLIDDKSRILFSGDAANINLLMNLGGAKISTALEGLLKIKSHENEFDRNYNGHVGYASYVDCVTMPDSVLDDCIAAMQGIIDGSIAPITYENFLRPDKPTTAVEYGAVRISYDPDFI